MTHQFWDEKEETVKSLTGDEVTEVTVLDLLVRTRRPVASLPGEGKKESIEDREGNKTGERIITKTWTGKTKIADYEIGDILPRKTEYYDPPEKSTSGKTVAIEEFTSSHYQPTTYHYGNVSGAPEAGGLVIFAFLGKILYFIGDFTMGPMIITWNIFKIIGWWITAENDWFGKNIEKAKASAKIIGIESVKLMRSLILASLIAVAGCFLVILLYHLLGFLLYCIIFIVIVIGAVVLPFVLMASL